jgi:uncharacterized protein with von Willebrand factor type A (vWA) domain
MTCCAAVATLDPGDLADLYWAGRTTMVTRRDQIPVYDRVFREYFGGATPSAGLALRHEVRRVGADLLMLEGEPTAGRESAASMGLDETINVYR